MKTEQLPEFRVGSVKDHLLAPFSSYYRCKKAISKESVEIQAVLPFVASSQDGRLLLVKNSKAGCTSMAQAIYSYDFGDTFEGNIHKEGAHLRQGYASWQQNLALLESGTPYVFSVVRNPEDRIVSAYFDFVVEKRNPMRRYHQKLFSHYGLDNIHDPKQSFGRFLYFVEEALQKDAWRSDRHWRPQVLNLWIERIRYDLLIRMENLEAGVDEIRSNLGERRERFPLVHANKSKSLCHFDVSKKNRLKIVDLFSSDFELYEGLAK